MLLFLASVTAARRRGLPLISPPPERAATVISLIRRVKSFPRFASVAPFLCLMVLHRLWPDMRGSFVTPEGSEIIVETVTFSSALTASGPSVAPAAGRLFRRRLAGAEKIAAGPAAEQPARPPALRWA